MLSCTHEMEHRPKKHKTAKREHPSPVLDTNGSFATLPMQQSEFRVFSDVSEKRSQMQVLYSRLQSDGYLFLPRMLPEREVLEARETIIDFIATTWKDTDMLSVKTDDGTGITLAQQLLFFIHSWYRQEEVCVKANCQSPVKLLDKQQLSHHPQVVSILEHSVLFQFFHDLYSFISTAEQRTEQHLSNSINDNNSMDTNNNNNNNNNQPTNNNHSNKHTIISTTADVITGNLDVPTMRSSDGDDNDNADKEESENSSNSNSEEEDNSESAEGDAVATFEFKWLRAVGYDQHTGVHMDRVFMGGQAQSLYTCWIPIGNICVDQGSLCVASSSNNSPLFSEIQHTYGKTKVGKDGLQSGWLCCDPPDLSQHVTQPSDVKWVTTDFHAGDVVVLAMNVIHCSLRNRTNTLRISCDTRWQLLSEASQFRFSNSIKKLP